MGYNLKIIRWKLPWKFITLVIVSLLIAFFSASAILISGRNEKDPEIERQFVEIGFSEVKIVDVGGHDYVFWSRSGVDMEHFAGCPNHAEPKTMPGWNDPGLKLNY